MHDDLPVYKPSPQNLELSFIKTITGTQYYVIIRRMKTFCKYILAIEITCNNKISFSNIFPNLKSRFRFGFGTKSYCAKTWPHTELIRRSSYFLRFTRVCVPFLCHYYNCIIFSCSLFLKKIPPTPPSNIFYNSRSIHSYTRTRSFYVSDIIGSHWFFRRSSRFCTVQ